MHDGSSSFEKIARLDHAALGETLAERLVFFSQADPDPRFADTNLESAAIEPWARAFARGNLNALWRRLSWDGLSLEAAARALRPESRLPGEPDWAMELSRIRSALAQEVVAVHGGDEELPFAAFWRPIWSVVAPGQPDFLPHSAWHDLERLFLRRLGRLGDLTLFELFESDRAQGRSLADFVVQLRREPTILWSAYPALARACAETVSGFRAFLSEFLARLEADRATVFGAATIVAIHGELSDPHRGGRQVLRIALSDGRRYFYKPRDLRLDVAIFKIFERSRARGLALAPPWPKTFLRDDYGWQEEIQPTIFADRDAVARAFAGVGALLAFAHVFSACDLHAENLIATTNGLAVVDAETFLQPARVRVASGEGSAGSSCLATGLLGLPTRGAAGQLRESGGIWAFPRHESPSRRRAWQNVGSDDLKLEKAPVIHEPGANAFWLDLELMSPRDFVDEIVGGFRKTWAFLAENGAALLAEVEDESLPVRVLFRSTQDYWTWLELTSLPRNQKSGIQPGLLFEGMLQVFAESREKPVFWPLVAAERRALESRDVPAFTLPAAATTLALEGGGEVVGFFKSSGLEACRARLASLDEVEEKRQIELIERALRPPLVILSAGLLTERCGTVALALAERILESDKKAATPENDATFGSGSLGTAIFFAALSRQVLSRQAPRFADSARAWAARPGRVVGFGLCSGAGGAIFGRLVLATLLGDQIFRDSAATLIRDLDPAAIAADEILDLEGGVAGLLLALLQAAQAGVEREQALALARVCGERLLATQRPLGSAGAAWPNARGLALLGYLHGAAGCARALAALAEAAGDQRFAVGATAALAYERSLFDYDRGNWPLLVKAAGAEPQNQFLLALCHGAPGGSMARAFLPATFHDRFLASDLGLALEATEQAVAGTIDHLCCGRVGRLAVLLACGHRLDVPAWRDEARAGLEKWLDELGRRGLVHESSPGALLKGWAGIGYTLLQFAAGDLPELIAFELGREQGAHWR